MESYNEYGVNWSVLAEPIKDNTYTTILTKYKSNNEDISYAGYNSNYAYMQIAVTKYKINNANLDICKKGYRPIYNNDKNLLLTLSPGSYDITEKYGSYYINNVNISYHKCYIIELLGGGGGGAGNFAVTEGGGGGGGAFIAVAAQKDKFNKIIVGSGGSGGANEKNGSDGSASTLNLDNAVCVTAGAGKCGTKNTGGVGGGASVSLSGGYKTSSQSGAKGGDGMKSGESVTEKKVDLNPEGNRTHSAQSGASSRNEGGGGGGASMLGGGGSAGYLSNGGGGGLGAGGGGASQAAFWVGKSGGSGGSGQAKIYY